MLRYVASLCNHFSNFWLETEQGYTVKSLGGRCLTCHITGQKFGQGHIKVLSLNIFDTLHGKTEDRLEPFQDGRLFMDVKEDNL